MKTPNQAAATPSVTGFYAAHEARQMARDLRAAMTASIRIGSVALVLTLLASLQAPAAEDNLHTPGWHEVSIAAGGTDRWCRVYVPTGLVQRAPSVLLLHGGTQSMRKMFASGGTQEWPLLAEQEKFLLLVPNGVNAETGDPYGDDQTWNDYRGRDAASQSNADDVGFIRQLLDWAADRYTLDPRRVYVAGASNGGMMTFRLCVEMPERFAAAVAFIAALPADTNSVPPPKQPTPLMIVNGTKDPMVQWEGGDIPFGRGKTRSVEQTVSWWVAANKANARLTHTEPLPDTDPKDKCRIYRTTYPPLSGGAPVVFCKVEGGGHCLPSIRHALPRGFLIRRYIGTACRDVEGAQLSWEFMKAHSAARE